VLEHTPAELPDEAGFADACFADQEDHFALVFVESVPPVGIQFLQLGLAAYKDGAWV
jgi:hypothetical protein